MSENQVIPEAGKKVHECRPQPNMCLHVAHYRESFDCWEVREVLTRG